MNKYNSYSQPIPDCVPYQNWCDEQEKAQAFEKEKKAYQHLLKCNEISSRLSAFEHAVSLNHFEEHMECKQCCFRTGFFDSDSISVFFCFDPECNIQLIKKTEEDIANKRYLEMLKETSGDDFPF